MDIFEAIRNRRSVRRFKKERIEDEKIKKIIEAGIWAPSAGNMQNWEVIIVSEESLKQKLVPAAGMRSFIGEAPLILVICANLHQSGLMYDQRGVELYSIQDAATAAENILLAIHALGLGACWVGSFDESKVASVLNIPSQMRPVTLLTVGYPDEEPLPPPRREVDEIIHWNTW